MSDTNSMSKLFMTDGFSFIILAMMSDFGMKRVLVPRSMKYCAIEFLIAVFIAYLLYVSSTFT